MADGEIQELDDPIPNWRMVISIRLLFGLVKLDKHVEMNEKITAMRKDISFDINTCFEGSTLLCTACEFGSVECAKSLIEKWGVEVFKGDGRKRAPLTILSDKIKDSSNHHNKKYTEINECLREKVYKSECENKQENSSSLTVDLVGKSFSNETYPIGFLASAGDNEVYSVNSGLPVVSSTKSKSEVFTCEVCGIYFLKKPQLACHKKKWKHLRGASYECHWGAGKGFDSCTFTCETSDAMKEHLHEHQANGLKKNQCYVCGAMIVRLRRHLPMHTVGSLERLGTAEVDSGGAAAGGASSS